VVVKGRLDDDALDSAYRHAIATVVPERYAGFGLPIIEAMARGCPVVTSDAACLPEVGGGVAAVVPVGDVGALTEVLDELVRSDARRADMGRAGIAWSATFTWARCAERHADAYRAAVERS
jgi:glycosyltransferase involved in cell wall biosynthesis